MSDPAKTPEEIEDVLASIRRLVSDNSPETVEEETQTPAAVAEDRLVLTPSFRVTDPEDPWVPVASAQQDQDAGEAAPADDAGWQPDDRLAHFDAVGEADEIEDQPVEPSEADLADLLHLDGVTAEPAEFESETGDDNWPNSGAEAALLTLVARREPVEADDKPNAAQGDQPSDDEDGQPDVSEADLAEELAQAEEHAQADDAQSDAEEQAFAQANVEEIETDEDADPQHGADEDASDGDTVEHSPEDEAPEDVSEEVSDGVDADEPSAVPVFSGRAATDDDLEASVEDLGEDPSPFSFPETEDGILDEETLREIIVDVVREELQGVLGQRITRNVRKMVRREVRLALAAEDLE